MHYHTSQKKVTKVIFYKLKSSKGIMGKGCLEYRVRIRPIYVHLAMAVLNFQLDKELNNPSFKWVEPITCFLI